MRILHVVPSFFPAVSYGGPVKALLDLCKTQVQAGLSVRVLTSDADGKQRMRSLSHGFTQAFGVPTLYAPVRLGEDLAPSLIWHLARHLPWADVVQISGVFSATSVLALVMARVFRCPVVLSPHGALMPWAINSGRGRGRRTKLAALKMLSPWLSHLAGWHTASQLEADGLTLLMQQGHLPSGTPTVQVPHGVFPEDIPPLDNDWSGPAKPPTLVFLGRVHPVKRLELLVQALAILRHQHPEARLLIAGPVQDSAYAARLSWLIRSLDLHQAVTFCGLVSGPQKAELLRLASALWLCSHMESFGLVVLEALSHGTPAVTTVQTPWACLQTEQVGHHVEAEPEALARATSPLLLLSPKQRQALAHRCQQFVRAHFLWPDLELRLRTFYRQTCFLHRA